MGASKWKTASAEEIAMELRCLVGLCWLHELVFGQEYPEDFKKRLRSLFAWLNRASEAEIRIGGPADIKSFQPLKQAVVGKLPFKRSWRLVCDDFLRRLMSEEFSFKSGIPLAWIADSFDLEQLRLPGLVMDLPFHARIGFGPFWGGASVEENLLLDDAFLFLVRAKGAYAELLKASRELHGKPTQEIRGGLTKISLNVCSYARMSVFALSAFSESFVNSVGEDFVLRNPGLAAEQIQILRGKNRKGAWLSLESKLEKFPLVINSGLAKPLVLSDQKQVKEPFLSFLGLVKSTRDSIAHFAQGKAPIWLAPKDWLELAEKGATATLECCKIFWEKCYPDRKAPEYLEGLDFKRLQQFANERLEFERGR